MVGEVSGGDSVTALGRVSQAIETYWHSFLGIDTISWWRGDNLRMHYAQNGTRQKEHM